MCRAFGATGFRGVHITTWPNQNRLRMRIEIRAQPTEIKGKYISKANNVDSCCCFYTSSSNQTSVKATQAEPINDTNT